MTSRRVTDLRRVLFNRDVAVAIGLLVALWVFNLTSAPIGKPLQPLFGVVFTGFFRTRGFLQFGLLGWSFLSQLVAFWLWWLLYVYVVGVALATAYRVGRDRLRAREDV